MLHRTLSLLLSRHARWLGLALATALLLVAPGDAAASSKGGTLGGSVSTDGPPGDWNLILGKAAYYQDFADNVPVGGRANFTFWTLQVPPYKYRWLNGRFTKYLTDPSDTVKNRAYNQKTLKFQQDAHTIVFLCPGTKRTFKSAVNAMTRMVDPVQCDKDADVGTDVSYTAFELICMREHGFHQTKTIWLDIKDDTQLDDAAGWMQVTQCPGSDEYMK